MLYSWKQTMRHMTKINDAYFMLKQQHIITSDPVYMDEVCFSICLLIKYSLQTIARLSPVEVAQERRLASFEDEEKARVCIAIMNNKLLS
jgi:hypothetical protein